MSAAAARRLPGGEPGGVPSLVLAGVLLDGDAARLAAAVDPAFLAEAGWDPARRTLSLPAGHRLLSYPVCRIDGCSGTAAGGPLRVCCRCRTRLVREGMSEEEIRQAERLPPLPPRSGACAVPGCMREPASAAASLCRAHARQFQGRNSPEMEQFLADPRVRPFAGTADCAVPACPRPSSPSGEYCSVHCRRWREAVSAGAVPDARSWRHGQQPAAGGGLVSLHGLPLLVAVEVLFGLQQRTRAGSQTRPSDLRRACHALLSQGAASVADCDAGHAPGSGGVRHLLRTLARDTRRALADPGSEQALDVWDLTVFGQPGRLDFTQVTQPWLRESVKQWAVHDLPRRRGRNGVNRVRQVVASAVRLSESLRARADHGDRAGMLHRRDIENFLARLGYLQSQDIISAAQRYDICLHARTVLTAVRDQGLNGPGQPAAGLPGSVAITRADIPARPERGEPGRDLPAEVMAALCAGLGALQPEDVKAAVEILIDTGRRPDEAASLPLDCLVRDAGGSPVLVYRDIKSYREGRRVPVSEHTATVITAQQQRVTARFPSAPRAELALFPSVYQNPHGRKHVCVDTFEARHRSWVDSLGELRTRDGTAFDPAKIVLYAYRHTYAQRHADAGVPIDVLAELMGHKQLDVTRGYYRVGEDRRRSAVDKVTAMQFDRHGNRTWRDARDLLDARHARYAIAQVAVPYGTCAEPSNVAAGGGACPVRFRCAGCDHFRTDVSYLPDLTAYLDDLLRTRERLAAMAGVDEWARAAAAPPGQEITRIRHLISRIQGDIAQLSGSERAVIDDAVATIRKHRAVHLGMPAIGTRTAAPEETA